MFLLTDTLSIREEVKHPLKPFATNHKHFLKPSQRQNTRKKPADDTDENYQRRYR